MSTVVFALLATVGGAILTGLVWYAWHLHRRLQAIELKHVSQIQEQGDRRKKLKEDAQRGIQVLAGALVRDELTLTEGSMRIAYLLNQLDNTAEQKQQYSVFFQLAEATAHIPILDAWQELSVHQRRAYTKEREGIEQAFQVFVLEGAQALLQGSMLNK